ncbi:uncharacterized protein MELLADRAFT_104267 [Melampsora larici-populina 98AG31]|uniref:Uncharacterized protein n=1 Tax=Melampsora larici-populina (strain 98AG31 / pathotype 3-4-7) TaxID=747676 RepID=F4RE56_MELLP|nr:uncharacterized protein MELLADRAFT_104267 [Melampsora larici-populina 98AG31]EGG09033.1 hypothetical protein MELLADRAFT_104267 [Melampsora larici-populina 98AG31]
MDSEEFQKQIDEALRKDEEIGKGKGVEGAGEEANDGREGKESERETEGQAREEELDNNLAPTVEENVPKQITTRQSKRKTAPPPPFPPPRPSTSKAIGTIRIKKMKLAEETIVNKPKRITKPPTNKPAPVKPAPRTQSRLIQQQPAEQNLLETNQQIDSSEEEDDEENQGTNGGGMWSGAYQTKNRQQRMTVGGITLGDADEQNPIEEPVSTEPSFDNSIAMRLDEEIGPEGTEMADIGMRNPRIYRLAERDTIRYNDDMYLDNPYAITDQRDGTTQVEPTQKKIV